MPYHDYEYQQDTTDIRKDTMFFTPENNAKKLLPHRLSLVLSAPTMWADMIKLSRKTFASSADNPNGDCLYGNDSNLLIVFYVQIMPDDFVMQLHRF